MTMIMTTTTNNSNNNNLCVYFYTNTQQNINSCENRDTETLKSYWQQQLQSM